MLTNMGETDSAASDGSTEIIACGAWLKNTACLWSQNATIWSPVNGDLGDPQARQALEDSVESLLQAATGPISAVAHDLHPDFFSTELALALAQRLGVPAVGVQHHHAHIGAVIAAHGIDRPVIGLALDGVGLGSDGQAWGGELLWVDGPQWDRLGHFVPLALPGGDRAAQEPWRMAASAMHACGRSHQITERFTDVVGERLASGVAQMLEQNLNCPMTSSAGRWFDAVAGALGLSVRQQQEAEAAQALECKAQEWLEQQGTIAASDAITIDLQNRIDPRALFNRLLDSAPENTGYAAAQFHVALADALIEWVIRAARQKETSTVCLAGGCFYNQILRQRISDHLTHSGFEVFLPGQYGCGDAGLAIGQAWVAGQQLGLSKNPVARGLEQCV